MFCLLAAWSVLPFMVRLTVMVCLVGYESVLIVRLALYNSTG